MLNDSSIQTREIFVFLHLLKAMDSSVVKLIRKIILKNLFRYSIFLNM